MIHVCLELDMLLSEDALPLVPHVDGAQVLVVDGGCCRGAGAAGGNDDDGRRVDGDGGGRALAAVVGVGVAAIAGVVVVDDGDGGGEASIEVEDAAGVRGQPHVQHASAVRRAGHEADLRRRLGADGHSGGGVSLPRRVLGFSEQRPLLVGGAVARAHTRVGRVLLVGGYLGWGSLGEGAAAAELPTAGRHIARLLVFVEEDEQGVSLGLQLLLFVGQLVVQSPASSLPSTGCARSCAVALVVLLADGVQWLAVGEVGGVGCGAVAHLRASLDEGFATVLVCTILGLQEGEEGMILKTFN